MQLGADLRPLQPWLIRNANSYPQGKPDCIDCITIYSRDLNTSHNTCQQVLPAKFQLPLRLRFPSGSRAVAAPRFPTARFTGRTWALHPCALLSVREDAHLTHVAVIGYNPASTSQAHSVHTKSQVGPQPWTSMSAPISSAGSADAGAARLGGWTGAGCSASRFLTAVLPFTLEAGAVSRPPPHPPPCPSPRYRRAHSHARCHHAVTPPV